MSKALAKSSSMKVSGLAPSVTAPRASSGCQGTPIFRTSTISSGASSAREISKPTATPPRGNARTTGCASFRCDSLSASRLDLRISCYDLPEMIGEPAAGVLDDRFEGARFFKKVRGAGYNDELLFAAQLG